MNIDKQAMLHWCDSVEETWHPKEGNISNGCLLMIPEQFLATAIRYLREICKEDNAVDERDVNSLGMKNEEKL